MLLSILLLILSGLKWVILADVLLSWIKPDTSEFPRNLTSQVSEPLCAPIRALISPRALGGIDISPMLVILLLQFMESIVMR